MNYFEKVLFSLEAKKRIDPLTKNRMIYLCLFFSNVQPQYDLKHCDFAYLWEYYKNNQSESLESLFETFVSKDKSYHKIKEEFSLFYIQFLWEKNKIVI